MSWDTVEDAFKELDKDEYSIFSTALSTYFKALQESGFTRREAFRLIEGYSKFVYEMMVEEYVRDYEEKEDEEDEDVASDGDDEVV